MMTGLRLLVQGFLSHARHDDSIFRHRPSDNGERLCVHTNLSAVVATLASLDVRWASTPHSLKCVPTCAGIKLLKGSNHLGRLDHVAIGYDRFVFRADLARLAVTRRVLCRCVYEPMRVGGGNGGVGTNKERSQNGWNLL